MEVLRFIVIFIQIVIKGCMESPAIKTALIFLTSIAALIFVPYWVGLLAVGILGIFPPPLWLGGFLCIVVIGVIVTLVVGVYAMLYEYVEDSIIKKRRR